MVFIQLKAEVRNFFAPYISIVEDDIQFTYELDNQVLEHEHWGEKGVRIPVCKGMWLVTEGLPIFVTHLFAGHSASDLLCFCHYHPNWMNPSCLSAFASLGLLPTKEQFTGLKILFPNAKIHTVFDAGIIGRVADCKVATWQLGTSARFSLVDDQVEFRFNNKRYFIPASVFSLSRFEKFSGVRSGIRTHKPKAQFETFYQSFTSMG
ncbi:hypothetical protein [Sphingobacterium chungjuense]|uniref:hypothetical protein n=1 Tax=Sphingobacterium chungjuense TaxID=2675553 RepID=UPI00140970B1|nr:hypothetical protein [Sphingobacterium chungjuense]